MSGWHEVGATAERPNMLDREEMPVDTVQHAGFLIGNMLVRIMTEGVAGGRIPASGFLHQSISARSRLEVSAPRGVFTLATGATQVVPIGAGVGVTPMLAMLHSAAATNAVTPRKVWWLLQPAIPLRQPARVG